MIYISCDQISTLLSLVKAGLGAAVIPSMAVPNPLDPAIVVSELPDDNPPAMPGGGGMPDMGGMM